MSRRGITSSRIFQDELLHICLPAALRKIRTATCSQHHRRKVLHDGPKLLLCGRCPPCSKFRGSGCPRQRSPSRLLCVGQHHLLHLLIHLGSGRGDVGYLPRDLIEHDLGQYREKVHHGPGCTAHDGTVGIRAAIRHGAIRVQTFTVEVRGEYRLFQAVVGHLVVRVDHGGEVADRVLATVIRRNDLSVYFIGLRERKGSVMNIEITRADTCHILEGIGNDRGV